jgi:hypothetical protein
MAGESAGTRFFDKLILKNRTHGGGTGRSVHSQKCTTLRDLEKSSPFDCAQGGHFDCALYWQWGRDFCHG